MVVSGHIIMENESPFQTQPAYVQKSSNKKRLVIIFVVLFWVIVIALGALYLLGSSAKHPTSSPTNPIPTSQVSAPPGASSTSAQLTATPSAAVSPTAASASLTSLSVSVLNGSGIPGAAGKVASALKSAGFSSVTTGNAAAYTYTGLTVYVKNSDNLSAVKQAIATAEPNQQATTSVKASIPTDVEIIIGK